ncbi:MAG: hypothetical protein WCB68_17090 [Pyrinomonadaceae bacterium]
MVDRSHATGYSIVAGKRDILSLASIMQAPSARVYKQQCQLIF